MRYFSVCSGIEAATLAWEPLGWTPVGFSEIEPFPCAVLAHHYPKVRNYGDLTRWKEWNLKPGSVDVLVGGTPCQSFSVAGLRKGLADPRGNLALIFLALADHLRPRWIVWENVPGVLSSSGGRDFGAFLGALGQLGYGFAYRVLDAQHFGVPQRRRRVFLVAHSRVECAGEVLFEPPGGGGDPSAVGSPSEGDPAGIADGARGGREGRDGRGPYWNGADVADTLDVSALVKRQTMPEKRRFAAVVVEREPHPPIGLAEELNARIDGYGTLKAKMRSGGFEGSVAVASDSDVIGTLNTECGGGKLTQQIAEPFTLEVRGREGERVLEYRQDGIANCLRTPNGGRDGIGMGAIAFAQNQRNEVRTLDKAGALGAIRRGDAKNETLLAEPAAFNVFPGRPGEDAPAELRACETDIANAVTVTEHARLTDRGTRIVERVPMAVRRLTPVECERLQGFPDGYTAIPWKGKPADACPDAPRYKVLGNSMAVPVMRWIGERLAKVESR